MEIIVYTSGVFDLLHTDHIRLLKLCRSCGTRLIVGVSTDEDAETYKRTPIIKYSERVELLNSIKYVDQVVTAPLYASKDFYNRFGISLHIQGDDNGFYTEGKSLGIMQFIGRGTKYSTTQIISKIIADAQFDIKEVDSISNSNIVILLNGNPQYIIKHYSGTNPEVVVEQYKYLDSFKIANHIELTQSSSKFYFYSRFRNNFRTMQLESEFDIKNVIRELYKYHIQSIQPPPRSMTFNLYTLIPENDIFYINLLDDILNHGVSCYSHNDLVPGNILFDTNNDCYIIDWEYSCYGVIELDIASLCLNAYNSRDINHYKNYLLELYPMNLNSKIVDNSIIFLSYIWMCYSERKARVTDQKMYQNILNHMGHNYVRRTIL